MAFVIVETALHYYNVAAFINTENEVPAVAGHGALQKTGNRRIRNFYFFFQGRYGTGQTGPGDKSNFGLKVFRFFVNISGCFFYLRELSHIPSNLHCRSFREERIFNMFYLFRQNADYIKSNTIKF